MIWSELRCPKKEIKQIHETSHEKTNKIFDLSYNLKRVDFLSRFGLLKSINCDVNVEWGSLRRSENNEKEKSIIDIINLNPPTHPMERSVLTATGILQDFVLDFRARLFMANIIFRPFYRSVEWAQKKRAEIIAKSGGKAAMFKNIN